MLRQGRACATYPLVAKTMSNSSKVQRWLIDQYQKVAHPPLWCSPRPPAPHVALWSHGGTEHVEQVGCLSGLSLGW